MQHNIQIGHHPVLYMGRVIFIILVCFILFGCSNSEIDPARFRVEGEVLIDGSPMEKGVIIYVPVSPTKGPKVTGIIDNGTYVIKKEVGPYKGNFIVKIDTISHEIEMLASGKPLKHVVGTESEKKKPRSLVSPEYNGKSTLTAIIQSNSENKLNFEVESIQKATN